jgi:hypothetical protein
MRILLCVAALTLVGCGGSSAPKSEPAPAPPPVKDLTSTLPADGRVSTKVVPNYILDLPKLPGGTLGDYEVKGKKYQLFVIDTDTNQQSAFLLLDLKAALHDPEYISYMGGYFGSDGRQPVFAFSKLHYLAGVVGLSKEEADPVARVLAARLR